MSSWIENMEEASFLASKETIPEPDTAQIIGFVNSTDGWSGEIKTLMPVIEIDKKSHYISLFGCMVEFPEYPKEIFQIEGKLENYGFSNFKLLRDKKNNYWEKNKDPKTLGMKKLYQNYFERRANT